MKPEKEIIWIAKLYKSPACPDPMNLKLSTISLCKKDFERILDASENSKIFNEWFEKMLNIHVIYFKESINISISRNLHKTTKGYRVDLKRLLSYAKKNNLYNTLNEFYNRDRII